MFPHHDKTHEILPRREYVAEPREEGETKRPDAPPAIRCQLQVESRSPGASVGRLSGAGVTRELRSRLMADRRTPFLLDGEKETLLSFLDYLRDSMILKVVGLDEASARQSTVQSGTSLVGLIRHLTAVEVGWFQFAFAGRDVSIPSEEIDPDDLVASVVSGYQAAIRISNQIANECDNLDQCCKRAPTTPDPMSLRWLLVHMVEETARHADMPTFCGSK